MNTIRINNVAALFGATVLFGASIIGWAQDASLTSAGAERSGNKDGTIPAFEGAPSSAGWSYGKKRSDSFKYKDDKPLLTIDSTNVDKYATKLSAGQIAVIKQTPNFKMDIYPSRRTCGTPDFVAENTKKNIGTAAIGADGWSLKEATVPGFPFPQPKTGTEAIWNAKMRYRGVAIDYPEVITAVSPRKGGSEWIRAESEQTVFFPWAAKDERPLSSLPQVEQSVYFAYRSPNPKMAVVPADPANYAALSVEIGRIRGYMRKDCSMTAVHMFLTDHKATTINRVIDAVKQFRNMNTLNGVSIRLASGNAGVLAAINDAVEQSELPMMLYVYAAIIILVLLVYRDLRAVIACCLPLTVGTFICYWFMKELQIGLTVATLPVMVLAVGIGVDYAFYIYNRLQLHLAANVPITKALEYSILEVGMATIFTAITLAVGVATWAFSELKFQADMGKLLAFMFLVNLVMAMTTLPALAVWLERLFPRRGPVRAPGLLSH